MRTKQNLGSFGVLSKHPFPGFDALLRLKAITLSLDQCQHRQICALLSLASLIAFALFLFASPRWKDVMEYQRPSLENARRLTNLLIYGFIKQSSWRALVSRLSGQVSRDPYLSRVVQCSEMFFLLLIRESFLPRGVGGGNLHSKGVGMLVVSLRGVNFGFSLTWSVQCSGENGIICSPYVAVKVLFRVSREETNCLLFAPYQSRSRRQ